MIASVLKWDIGEVTLDSDRSGKIVESWVYNQIAPLLDINPDYSISQYRDSKFVCTTVMRQGLWYNMRRIKKRRHG